MILKIIMLGAVFVMLYRFAGGKFALPQSKPTRDKNDDTESDALEECVECGTYVTHADSIQLKGKLYCSKECIPN